VPFACFVLSTGRCGTQSLAGMLGAAAGDAALVQHEPIEYPQRLALGWPRREPVALPAELLEHLQSIEETLTGRNYIECGHPCWSTIPQLLRVFAGRVRIVHLVRNPVPVAHSWITHRAFRPPVVPQIPERVLLTPFDGGVRFPQYREGWSALPPHEKVLYYWLEVNALALELQSTVDVPWLTIRFEDFIRGEANDSLAQFLELESIDDVPRLVDRHRHGTELTWDEARITQHPHVMKLAEHFGYDAGSFDALALRRRYFVLSDGRPMEPRERRRRRG